MRICWSGFAGRSRHSGRRRGDRRLRARARRRHYASPRWRVVQRGANTGTARAGAGVHRPAVHRPVRVRAAPRPRGVGCEPRRNRDDGRSDDVRAGRARRIRRRQLSLLHRRNIYGWTARPRRHGRRCPPGRPRSTSAGSASRFEPHATAISALVREAGSETLVMVDPNCHAHATRARPSFHERLRDLIRFADVVKTSEADLAYLEPDQPPQDTARALLARGPAIVLLTNGRRGATVLTARDEAFVEAPRVEVVDTIGAGDAFGAAWLGGWVADGLRRARPWRLRRGASGRGLCRPGGGPDLRAGGRGASARREGGRGVVLRVISASQPGGRRC